MPGHIEGKVIVVTGGAGGFGRLLVQKCSARGARVVAADIDEAGLQETLAGVEGPGEAIAVRVDVTRLDEMRGLAATAVETFGGLDVMVNNAGTMPLALYADPGVAADAWSRCIDINIKGVLNGIMAAHDAMISQGRGHVINISSIYGNYPVAGAAVYGATKAAVTFLSEALRQESMGRIKVTTIRPTGVPGTGLGAGVINPAALGGILGKHEARFMQTLGEMMGGAAVPELSAPGRIEYFSLSPELLADQIVFAIDQPWGVSISDLTVRASGDTYVV